MKPNNFEIQLNKKRDMDANENYWSNAERYSIDAYKIGFNAAIKLLLTDPDIIQIIQRMETSCDQKKNDIKLYAEKLLKEGKNEQERTV